MADGFNVTNLPFIELLYQRFLEDPSSVAPEWQQYFEATEPERDVGLGPSTEPSSIFRGMAAPSVAAAPNAPSAEVGAASLPALPAHTPNPAHLQLIQGLEFFSGMWPH